MTSPVDSFLRDAVSAARDRAADGVDDGAATRLRVRESLTARPSRRRFSLIAALIATMFGSTAFAYFAGWRPPWSKQEAVVAPAESEPVEQIGMRLPERGGPRAPAIVDAPPATEVETPAIVTEPAAVVDGSIVADKAIAADKAVAIEKPVVDEPSSAKTVAAAPKPRTARPRPAPVASIATPAPAITAPATPAPVTTAPATTAPTITAPATAPAPATVTPATTRPVPSEPRITSPAPRVALPGPDPELTAYRAAHEVHFRGSDPKRALVAWDTYLARYPDGKLALDARYSRALTLVKLARYAEARAALAPFASGSEVNAYRQREAAQILAAIRDR